MNELTVSATEANRSFSRMLRMVRDGGCVRITSRGETVAVMVPPGAQDQSARDGRDQALEELQRHWTTLPSVTVGPWTREELYNRD